MYKQIIPSHDWFYVNNTDVHIVIWRIAAWCLTEDGLVIGLISIDNSMQCDESNKMAKLVSVPPNNSGMYKHKDELTEEEKKALNTEGYKKHRS